MDSEKIVTKELVTQAKENLSPLSRAEAMRWLQRTEPQLHALVNRCAAQVAATLERTNHENETVSRVCEAVERSTLTAIEALRLCHLFCDDTQSLTSHGSAKPETREDLVQVIESPEAEARETPVDWLSVDDAYIRRLSAERAIQALHQVEPESAAYLSKKLPRMLQPLRLTNASDDALTHLRQDIMHTLAIALLTQRHTFYAFHYERTGMSVPETATAFGTWRKDTEAERRQNRASRQAVHEEC